MVADPFEKGKLSRALDHFTRADQVDQLIEAREADPDRGFMARLLTLCSLPRTDPGSQLQYVRQNGPYRLTMTATGKYKLPYGTLPRLLLAWMCTEAVRTQSRDLVLGRSLSKFMEKLGMAPVGSSRTRLRNQMHRFFNASVRLAYTGAEGEASVAGVIASRIELWWNPKRPDQPALWESKIRLGEELFEEIILNPVPIEMHTLKALKRSPLGLDLYLWLTYRVFSLEKSIFLPWKRLYRQFGANPAKANDKDVVNAFRKKCLRELVKIHTAWPEFRYSTAKGHLVLFPSRPLISPTKGQE